MHINFLSVFPGLFPPYMEEGIIGRAHKAGIFTYKPYDIRAYTEDKHGRTDDYPFGGGKGLLMTAQPIEDCLAAAEKEHGRFRRIFLSPEGRLLDVETSRRLAAEPGLTLLCGHYEGVDERAVSLMDEEISVGDYILTGGELAALALADSVLRFVPGVLDAEVHEEESLYGGLLEAPQYTRPYDFRGRKAPDILLGGHHAHISEWKKAASVCATAEKRPELLAKAGLDDNDVRAARERMAYLESLYGPGAQQ